jgi:GNAT superfamily N-acetyltransferase
MTEGDFSPLTLLHQQLALERKGVDSSGRLFRLPGENPDDMPGVLAARLADGCYVAYFRDDLTENVMAELHALTPEQLFHEQAQVMAILGVSDPAWCGRTYFFSESLPAEEYPLAVKRNGKFVVEVDGVAASEAWSSRSTDFAAELAVETRPEFQRRGYGRQVCAAWASHQLAAGRIAFYSHDVRNTASAALARSLSVQFFMDNVNYA